jgi:putative mRNA 3-end processing factor
MDRGFVLSDHADWPGLIETISATGAERVWVTHGFAAIVARWLQEQGVHAAALDTQFGEEGADDAAADAAAEATEGPVGGETAPVPTPTRPARRGRGAAGPS